MTRAQRLLLAERRLRNVLRTHVVATDRTLEQKISDAGPTNQRIEPGILTQARKAMVLSGRIGFLQRGKTTWYYLPETTEADLHARLDVLEPIYARTQDGDFKVRLGQALEISVYKALSATNQPFLGGFSDLGAHDDGSAYKRVEPQDVISGNKIEKGPLDYVLFQTDCIAGIEVKNYRTWLYPHGPQVKDLLSKCSDIGAVPVLIARRVPFITFRLLNLSGGIIHQNFNQLYPTADAELAGLARDKTLLGYHDVRVGNDPDKRMQKFIGQNLPEVLEEAKASFDEFRDTHAAYGKGRMTYYEWMRAILVGRGIWAEEEEEPEPGLDDHWEPP